MPAERLIVVGKILGAHGVKGLVKLASFTSEPEDIAAYGPVSDKAGKREWKLKLQSFNKDHFIVDLGLKDRNEAEAMRGTEVCVPRAKLPKAKKGEYYYADLIGLDVRVDGKAYGKVAEVANYGAGDILAIEKARGGIEMFIFSEAVVPEVDIEGGYLTLVLPEVTEAKEEGAEE